MRIFQVCKPPLQLEGSLLVLIWLNSLDQRSSTFLTPGTGFEDLSGPVFRPVAGGEGMVWG